MQVIVFDRVVVDLAATELQQDVQNAGAVVFMHEVPAELFRRQVACIVFRTMPLIACASGE